MARERRTRTEKRGLHLEWEPNLNENISCNSELEVEAPWEFTEETSQTNQALQSPPPSSFLLPSARFHFRCAACAIAAAAAQPNTVISFSYSYAAVSKKELRSCPADTV